MSRQDSPRENVYCEERNENWSNTIGIYLYLFSCFFMFLLASPLIENKNAENEPVFFLYLLFESNQNKEFNSK